METVTPDEAAECAALLDGRFPGETSTSAEIAGWMQTGWEVFGARAEGVLAAVARHWSEEGIDHFDHLASARPWAGLALVRFLARHAQDRGIRLVRTEAPDEPVFEDYLGYSGYRPVGRREAADGSALLVFERRVPLLTVREMRRSDADDLARLTGSHPWDFEQRIRPGWFVLADGDSFAGFISVKETTPGLGMVANPVLLEGYSGRRLELWMVERVAHYAETHGIHSLELATDGAIESLARDFEDAGWARSGDVWSRGLAGRPSYLGAEGESAGSPEDWPD